jgi:hypothetical protein
MRLFVVLLGLGIFVYAPCVVYMFPLVFMMLGLPMLTRRFAYSTPDQLGNNFV